MPDADVTVATPAGAPRARRWVALGVVFTLALAWAAWRSGAAVHLPTPLALALATLVSEDLACIAAGELVRRGEVSAVAAVLACAAGIFVGDVGLWFVGYGARVLGVRWAWSARLLASPRLAQAAEGYRRHAGKLILAARFMPGTRMLLYVAAGTLGHGLASFAGWVALAVLLWTPVLVLGVALLGEAVAAAAGAYLASGWVVSVGVVIAAWAGLLLTRACSSERGRAQLVARITRLWRYEFWPAWLFYLPLAPWVALLAARYGPTTFTAANPGIPHGGVVGESKHAILSRLRSPYVLPAALLPPGDAQARPRQLQHAMDELELQWPVVLKPDAGQRGSGVRLARDLPAATRVLTEQPGPLLVQAYHPGPHEVGVFYYRMPDQPRGRVFSVTDKVFPAVTGDGVATLETLIWRHPRYRMQAATFLARLGGQSQHVPTAGEVVTLGHAGNHCQGTLFRDGRRLLTPALEAAIDEAARSFEGFFIGRFDLRYSCPDELATGRGFGIVELNGVTSESTNIYDPERTLPWAYAVLARQWLLLYRVGAANRARGVRPSRMVDLWREVRRHLREPGPPALSD